VSLPFPAVAAARHRQPGAPLTRFLTHPAQVVHHLANLLLSATEHRGAGAALAVAIAAATAVAGRA